MRGAKPRQSRAAGPLKLFGRVLDAIGGTSQPWPCQSYRHTSPSRQLGHDPKVYRRIVAPWRGRW